VEEELLSFLSRPDYIEMADPNQAQLAALLALLGEFSCEIEFMTF
jgi:hypothetical protein